MKKLLSVILALTMVLSSVVFAAPSAVTIMDTAEEFKGGDDMAELSADAGTLSRGINLFTGTKDAFDGDNYSDFSSWLLKGGSTTLDMVSVVNDPSGVRDKVLNFEIPAEFTDSGFPNFYFDFGGDLDTDIGHPYVYFAFDYQKYVSDTSGYTASDNFWMLNTFATSGDFAPVNFSVAANDGWVHYGKVMDFSVNSSGYSICSSDNPYYSSQDINKKIIFQFGNNTTNTVPVNFLFDNLVFAPAYKVTYYNADGTEALKEEYVVVDDDGNLLSSYSPSAILANGYAYGEWALTQGGEAVTEVALTDNADISLYATLEEEVFSTAKISLDAKLTKKGDTAKATAVFSTDVALDTSKITWTSEDTDIARVVYDKDKNVATVTAVGAGTTNLTFDYDGSSFTDTITVADGPVVATSVTSGSAISEFSGLDLDVYEYVTVNVTNTASSAKTVKINDTYSVSVPAGVTGYDVYLDLSDESVWTDEAGDIVVTSDSGVTINNAKLWAVLNVENGIGFTAEKNFLTEAGEVITVTAYNSSDLEGVYGDDFNISVEADVSVATYKISGNSVTITAGTTGSCVVTITAVNTQDTSVAAEKDILVNIIEGKSIAYKWDFNDASNTGFAFGGRYTGSEFTGTTANVRASYATLPGGTEVVPVELSSGTVDGNTVTIVKNYEGLYGSMTTSATPSPAFSVAEYPYLVVRARANNAAAHQLGIYLKYSVTTWSDDNGTKLVPQMTTTNDYVTYVFDASESAAVAEAEQAGQTFSAMQFSTNTKAIISSEILTSSDGTYYIEGEVEYNPDSNIEIDEMYFANYDPTKIYYGVSLEADKTELSGDGIITLYPEVFADGEIANDGVDYTVDKDGYVSITKNSDGTATVTPLKDGTVTITASAIMDSAATASVTLTLSDIPTRTVAYDLKLMLIGNSYLEHGYLATADKTLYNGYLDKNDTPRGMAATSPELDYYARLCHYLTNGFEGTFTSKKQGGAVIEEAWKQGLASGKPQDLTGWDREVSLDAMKTQWANILDYMDREQPNLITIQLAENAAHAYDESAEWFYDELFKVIDEHRPEKSIVVIISPMGTGAASRVQPTVAAKYGFYWADNTWIGDDYGWEADNPYLAFKYYPDYTNSAVVEFRSHPGNEGMDELAKSAYAIFEKQIPTTIEPQLVTVPTDVEIVGTTSIATEGGTTKLSVKITPESATPNMIWSVDNEYLASVDETGLVTAKLNGTVNVTATSAYDETVTDTVAVTISGQPEHYTLTYAAGTTEEVTGLPEAFAYAAADYEFPALVANPERNGYKFLGWSEEIGGEVQTSVEMTGEKTVYAVWEFADNWSFDKDGDLEGIMVAGFNTAVKDGVMSTISYNGVAVGFQDETLLLSTSLYKTFKANISMSTVNEDDYFTLTIITDAGEYTFTTETLVGANDYTFDISSVEGTTITGFSLFTSNDADGVGMTVDYAKFGKKALRENVSYDTLEVTASTMLDAQDKLVTVGTLTVDEGATLYLAPGSYVIDSLDGTGNIEASVNANVVIKSDTKPNGYVEIEIGTCDEETIRYAEIGGCEYEITSDESVYGLIAGDETLLLEITSVGTETETRYFLVKDGAATEVPMGSYMYNNPDENTIRVGDEKTNNKSGVRFAATVDVAKKNAITDYNITEYGYIIGLEETINNNGGQLNFELRNEVDGRLAYVSGKAYVRGEYDKVFSKSDDYHIFTGVLYGAPEDQYGKRLVAKTYTKVTVDGEEYVVYGEPMVASFYDIAKALKAEGNLSDEATSIVDDIIAKAESISDDSIGMPGDDLWS